MLIERILCIVWHCDTVFSIATFGYVTLIFPFRSQ